MSELEHLTYGERQQILLQLNQGIYNHQQWHNHIVRSLVCHLRENNHDTEMEAHKTCQFGKWYYSSYTQKIEKHSGFINLGTSHKQMHVQAAFLLKKSADQLIITPNDYDLFVESLERFRLEIGVLQREFENLLYNHDALTGAITRINMPRILFEQLQLSKRQNKPCCLAMIDIDNFKKLNDTYGHQVGDVILSTLSHFIMKNIRVYDKIFRYGGDEFLICFPFITLKEGKEMVERMCKDIANTDLKVGFYDNIRITISIGLVLFDAEHTIEYSVDCADKAMYEAKMGGRNCVKVWLPEIQ